MFDWRCLSQKKTSVCVKVLGSMSVATACITTDATLLLNTVRASTTVAIPDRHVAVSCQAHSMYAAGKHTGYTTGNSIAIQRIAWRLHICYSASCQTCYVLGHGKPAHFVHRMLDATPPCLAPVRPGACSCSGRISISSNGPGCTSRRDVLACRWCPNEGSSAARDGPRDARRLLASDSAMLLKHV